MFLIAITTVFIVDIFEVKNLILIVIIGGLMVAFPGVTETFFFGFTADGYMLAMVFAAFAIWITRIDMLSCRHIIAAIAAICCSCAIYQAYVSFAIVLALCYLIIVLLDNKFSLQQIRKWIAAQIIIYIVGLAVYYGIWKLLMSVGGYVANDYQGISTLSLNFLTILRGIPNTLKAILLLFFEWNPIEYGWTLYAVLNVFFLVSTVIAVGCTVIKTKIYKRKIEFLLLLLSGIAIPFAACIWLFVSEDVGYRPMMLQSICLVYILAAILYERYFKLVLRRMFAVLLICIIFNNGIMANIAYYYMNRTYYATFASASEMIARIHELDTDTKKMRIVGNKLKEVSLDNLDNIQEVQKIHMLGQLLESNLMFDEIHLINFMNETFYECYESAEADWEMDERISDMISEMKCWPKKNSIELIDDVIVIKLNEEEIKN